MTESEGNSLLLVTDEWVVKNCIYLKLEKLPVVVWGEKIQAMHNLLVLFRSRMILVIKINTWATDSKSSQSSYSLQYTELWKYGSVDERGEKSAAAWLYLCIDLEKIKRFRKTNRRLKELGKTNSWKICRLSWVLISPCVGRVLCFSFKKHGVFLKT